MALSAIGLSLQLLLLPKPELYVDALKQAAQPMLPHTSNGV